MRCARAGHRIVLEVTNMRQCKAAAVESSCVGVGISYVASRDFRGRVSRREIAPVGPMRVQLATASSAPVRIGP